MLTIENVEVSFEVEGDDDQKLKQLIHACIRFQLERDRHQQARDRAARQERLLVPRPKEVV